MTADIKFSWFEKHIHNKGKIKAALRKQRDKYQSLANLLNSATKWNITLPDDILTEIFQKLFWLKVNENRLYYAYLGELNLNTIKRTYHPFINEYKFTSESGGNSVERGVRLYKQYNGFIIPLW